MITCHLQCNTVIVLNKHVCIVICLYIYQGSIQTPQGGYNPPVFVQHPLTCIQQRRLLGGIKPYCTIKPIIDSEAEMNQSQSER